jgi:tubulin polyglutamylase TTLL6/13
MSALTRKNNLARNLAKLARVFPDDFNFTPKTWLLPTEASAFRSYTNTTKGPISYIVKPEAGCQGRGIWIARKPEDIDTGLNHVVQEYIRKPLLIDGLKFDLRLYVLVTGVNPLRIFIHEEGLVRFATVPYNVPARTN